MRYRDPSPRRALSSLSMMEMDTIARATAVAAVDAHTSLWEPDCHECRDRGCDYCTPDTKEHA